MAAHLQLVDLVEFDLEPDYELRVDDTNGQVSIDCHIIRISCDMYDALNRGSDGALVLVSAALQDAGIDMSRICN